MSSNKKAVAKLLGAAGTGLYIALAGWAYTAATVGDMIAAGILLFLAFFVGISALVTSEELGAFANQSRTKLNLTFSVALAMLSSIIFAWCYSHRLVPQSPVLPAVKNEGSVLKSYARW